MTLAEKLFTRHYEVLPKDVKRDIGVLQASLYNIMYTCHQHSVTNIVWIMKVYVTIPSMIVNNGKESGISVEDKSPEAFEYVMEQTPALSAFKQLTWFMVTKNKIELYAINNHM